MSRLRPAAFALLVGGLASAGCLNPGGQEKEPLVLGQDTRSALAGANGGTTTAKAVKPALFDPSATGGSGVNVQNSFNRTTPGAGTGTSTGNFVAQLPPPQVGAPPPVAVPAVNGASYGQPMAGTGRTSLPRAATPPPVAPTAPGSPFGPDPVALDAPLNDPPVRPVGMKEAVKEKQPDPSGPIRPVMPDATAAPASPPVALPAMSAPLPPVSTGVPLPPAPPASPGSAATDPLPSSRSPAAPTYVPSPTESPIPGVQAPPKLPPAPPIRPQ